MDEQTPLGFSEADFLAPLTSTYDGDIDWGEGDPQPDPSSQIVPPTINARGKTRLHVALHPQGPVRYLHGSSFVGGREIVDTVCDHMEADVSARVTTEDGALDETWMVVADGRGFREPGAAIKKDLLSLPLTGTLRLSWPDVRPGDTVTLQMWFNVIRNHMNGQIDGFHSRANFGLSVILAAWGNVTSLGVPPPDGGYGPAPTALPPP
jgi:hypothetical protein